eukprot:4690741-Pleurochrysis_carterae.AAC.1
MRADLQTYKSRRANLDAMPCALRAGATLLRRGPRRRQPRQRRRAAHTQTRTQYGLILDCCVRSHKRRSFSALCAYLYGVKSDEAMLPQKHTLATISIAYRRAATWLCVEKFCEIEGRLEEGCGLTLEERVRKAATPRQSLHTQ